MDLLTRLQTAPGAEVVLATVGDEPGVYVVGGAVRDVLLDRVPRELDLVVEGDAVALARRVAARAGGELTVHERFGTATVRAEGYAFDLAGARREAYARPGALPDVELGASLQEDLARRDFTVNAIAVSLADGSVTAVADAQEDLQARRLRVLHEHSFEDDPTRMLRLARYAARLDFAPDAPVDPALLRTVTGDRAGHELRLLLEEPQPRALELLERLGLGRELFGDGFRVPAHARTLAACVTAVADLPDRLARLGFPARERTAIASAAARFAPLSAALSAPRSDAELYALLHRERPGTVELLAEAGNPQARRWLDDVRHRGLAITGDDLLAAGLSGAAVGLGLRAATEAMLAGDAPDRERQLRAALTSQP